MNLEGGKTLVIDFSTGQSFIRPNRRAVPWTPWRRITDWIGQWTDELDRDLDIIERKH